MPASKLVRLVILTHRYLGIPLSVLFVAWFLSGVVMVYTRGMPADSEAEKLTRQEEIALGAISVTPSRAAQIAGIHPRAAHLQSLLGRPVYRFDDGSGRHAGVFADDGSLLTAADPDTGARIVSRSLDIDLNGVRFVKTLSTPDQWTLTQQRHLPLHRYELGDAAATYAYVSAETGEIALTLSRRERGLAWLGAIPHWLYFTPLRSNQPTWYWTVVVLSAAGCLVATLGLILSVTQLHRSKRSGLPVSIRYRGWMRWHYYSGLFIGGFAFTWVFSGLLSMQPFDWMNRRGLEIDPAALAGGPFDIAAFSSLDADRWLSLQNLGPAVDVELRRIQDRPHLQVHSANGSILLVSVDTMRARSTPFSAGSIISSLDTGNGAMIDDAMILDEYDAYYYDRDGRMPLPVLRVKFDDGNRTWVYVDVNSNRIVRTTHRFARLERWLFNGLHSLDFPFWYSRRPWWDIGVIVLSIGGLVLSGLGLMLGWRRVRRALRLGHGSGR